METPSERILLVESDPETANAITHQILQPMGFLVDIADSASAAIQSIEKAAPDVIITDLLLPGISCKDLLIALKSQGWNIPTIVITPKGQERDALQAFRLGAVNFLVHPIREAEVVSVVEDTLKPVRQRKSLNSDSQRIDQVKLSLEQRIRRMNEIFSIAKLIPSAASQQALFEKITSTAAQVTEADSAWLTVFDSQKNKYILRACQSVGEDIASKYHLSYEDDLHSVVSATGQVVSTTGEELARIYPSSTVNALLIVPIKLKKEIIGMLSAARRAPTPFTHSQQEMLEILAEYTLNLLENLLRYQALEQRIFQLEHENIYTILDSSLKNDLLRQTSLELRNPLKALTESLDTLLSQADRKFTRRQNDCLNALQEEADVLLDIADTISVVHHQEYDGKLEDVDLIDLVREAIGHLQGIAQLYQVSFRTETPPQPVMVTVFPSHILKVIEGAISNALKYGEAKSQIIIKVEQQENKAVFSIIDHGDRVREDLLGKIFDKKTSLLGDEAQRFGGIGISLPMMKEIISIYGGEIWVDSEQREGFIISFSLPI